LKTRRKHNAATDGDNTVISRAVCGRIQSKNHRQVYPSVELLSATLNQGISEYTGCPDFYKYRERRFEYEKY